jgi:cyclopropane fatty-acyl-phospholipid synthase-like methyltransferase
MWNVNGKHYEKTLNSWLENLDKNKDKAVEALKSAYG